MAVDIPLEDQILTDSLPPSWEVEAVKQRAAQFRIEALRAASRIVAGIQLDMATPQIDGKDVSVDTWVIYLAEQFARWLEDGKQ